MRQLVIAVVSVCALTGAASAADASSGSWDQRAAVAFSSDISVYGGWGNEDWSEGRFNPTKHSVFGGLVRTNFFLDPKWAVQFDFNAEHAHENESAYDYTNWNFASHVSARDSAHLLGGFASIGHVGSYDYGDMDGTVGLEGLIFLGNVHLYGQAGWTRTLANVSSYPTSSPYVHGEIRYFPWPDVMLAGNVGVASHSQPGYAANVWRWGADLEARQPGTAWGGFLSYQGSSEGWSDGTTHAVNTVLVGMKLYFGKSTLEEASRSGATLRDLNPWTGTNAVRDSY